MKRRAVITGSLRGLNGVGDRTQRPAQWVLMRQECPQVAKKMRFRSKYERRIFLSRGKNAHTIGCTVLFSRCGFGGCMRRDGRLLESDPGFGREGFRGAARGGRRGEG